MKNKIYSSKDFSSISSELVADNPNKLIHKNILGSSGDFDGDFSSKRNHLVKVIDLPSKNLSMTIGGLNPMESTREHRHNYETIIYIIKGKGESVINDRVVSWEAGDAVYVPIWSFHSHRNTSEYEEALYVASENAPMLQNLGIALREEK